MAVTNRQQLIDAVEARLKTISAFSGRVWPWRRTPVSLATEVPCALFFDREASVVYAGVPVGFAEHRLKFEIEAYAKGSTTASQARAMLGDMIAAIWQDPQWGGLARWTEIDNHELALEHTGEIVGGILLTVTIVYRAPHGSL